MDIKKKVSYEVSLGIEDVNKINKHITAVRDGATGKDLIRDVEIMVATAYVTGVREGKAEITNELE
jgi:hypothetical protein